MVLAAHHKAAPAISRGRQEVPSKATNTARGLEAMFLHMTRDSVIGSLVRYGVAFAGSCTPGDFFLLREAQIGNFAPR